MAGQRLPVSQFELTAKVKDKVVGYLSGLHLLSDNAEDVHIVEEMLAQVNDSNNRVADVVSDELSAAVLEVLKSSVSDPDAVPVGQRNNFNTRPWGLAASNMTSLSYFNECFGGEAKLIDYSTNPESRCIDFVLNDHFAKLRATAGSEGEGEDAKKEKGGLLQKHNGIQLFEKFFVPVHALPDAVWTHEGQEYVLEIKTVRNAHSMLRYNKLRDWLYQVACYQLNSYEDVAAFNSAGTPLPEDTRRYLLAVLLLSNTGSRLIVLEANRANRHRCNADWLKWFEHIPKSLEIVKKPSKGATAGAATGSKSEKSPATSSKITAEEAEENYMKPVAVVKDLNKYFNGEVQFGQIKSVAKEHAYREQVRRKEEEYRKYVEEQEAAGFTVVRNKN